MRDDFIPDWASAPGETIADMLSERGLSVEDFASKMGLSVQSAADLLEGKSTISLETARKLSEVVGGSLQFWIARDGQYRDDAMRQGAKYRDWLREVPIGDMLRFGWIDAVRPTDELTSCLRYFDVRSVSAWHEKYANIERMAAFRTSPSFESRPASVAAWLRQGEIAAETIRCKPWNPDVFRSSLQQIRRLTKQKDPRRFISQLQALCAEAGVAFVAVPCPNGCRASGATRMLFADRMLLQLSGRYLSDDHFWFTFFHEAGHALLHGNRGLFVDGISDQQTFEEGEADDFAERIIIPDASRREFEGLRGDSRRVLAFAQKIGIAPGIVVGQMQHRGIIPRNWLNALKRRYTWE